MVYFTSRDISAIALSASLWAVLNWLMAPIFWELTHLPILCDMAGVSLLTLTVWWTRKPGAASFMGLKNLRRIPVVENGKYVGIVGITDVNKALFFNKS